MCGIAGIVHADLPPSAIDALLVRMSRAMTHRGPDDEGRVVLTDERAGLAARRLSIVDVANGRQPVSNEDGTVHVVFNGEIYNHVSLRERLLLKGHHFHSRCDTEVIAHLYEDVGETLVHELDGMFALAVFDRRARRLLLARDGPGMKPLYVAGTPRGLLFASAVKALLASGQVEAQPDPAAINAYLTLGYFPGPRSGLLGIEKLGAGECLIAERGQVRRTRFWRYRCREDRPPRRDEDYGEELDGLLQQTVRSHLAADVPVGSLVSGGWDSSLITTLAAREAGSRLKTFSIVFPDHARRDESRYSRLLTNRLGTDHHEIEFRASQLPDLLLKAMPCLEEPVAASPSLLMYLVSSLASQHVKTVLTGEGADELFGGYSWLRGGGGLRRPIESRGTIGTRIARWLRSRQAPASAAGRRGADDGRSLDGMRSLSLENRRRVLRPDFRPAGPDLEGIRLDPEIAASCGDRLQARLALEFTARLPDRVLLHADKMSMAHSLETRMPFLDRGIVAFAERLPSNMKIRGRQRKYVLSLLGRHLPPEIARRRKQGLDYPKATLTSGPVAKVLRDMLFDGAASGGPFERRFLEAVYDGWLHRGQPLFHRPLLLVFLQVWWNTFVAR
jgi:asparagine synthase (glutamine-hydrolysing)